MTNALDVKVQKLKNTFIWTKSSVCEGLRAATQMLSPAWDARSYIAVNPLFGLKHFSFHQAVNFTEALTGTRLLPPLSFFAEKYNSKEIEVQDLDFALQQIQLELDRFSMAELSRQDLLKALKQPDSTSERQIHCLTDHQTELQSYDYGLLVTREISKWLSAYYDQGQAQWVMPRRSSGLYGTWRNLAVHDQCLDRKGIAFQQTVKELPNKAEDAISAMAELIEQAQVLSNSQWRNYFLRLYNTTIGWSSFLKGKEFERDRDGHSHLNQNHLLDLAAIRMAYDICFLEAPLSPQSFSSGLELDRQSLEKIHPEYVWQVALEAAYRRKLLKKCRANQRTEHHRALKAQLCFCIDVRSEPIRRHIEQSYDEVETLGFAGFFGIPLEVVPLNSNHAQQQCPVLIKPRVKVDEKSAFSSSVLSQLMHKLSVFRLKTELQKGAGSCFSYVETMWLPYFCSLLWNAKGKSNLGQSEENQENEIDLSAISHSTKVEIAESVLRQMGLLERFAPLIVLFGHASTSTNNPHASGLDCGACCGQSGKINAQVVAKILNDSAVRKNLETYGISIPKSTVFIAGLHNTTRDTLTLHQPPQLTSCQVNILRELEDKLRIAELKTQKEKAKSLSFCEEKPTADITRELINRAADWSEVRPEWGLANNASFMIARRSRTREVDLQGRAFLHEYDFTLDPQGEVLEQILTAPMIVTNWINMQYYASALCPQEFGAGDKTLHNVTGTIGVLEGGGGDLKIGLSKQSVRYKGKLAHQPLKLQVVIEAPCSLIASIIQKHQILRDLIGGGWLSIVSLEPSTGEKYLYVSKGWINL